MPAVGQGSCCQASAPATEGTSRVSMTHPLRWRSHLDPSALASGSLDVITRGAMTIGAAGDAVVACDYTEQARRRSAGLGAVTSLWLLDAVMTLPAGVPVRVADLSADVWASISAAPRGVAAVGGGGGTRLLKPPGTVAAGWGRGAG